MSDRGGWDYRRQPKKPPPARGIRMKKVGTTWWGQRWIEALQNVLAGDSSRLARGRTYARAGRTHDLVVEGGKVTAKVTGSRATPYKITIALVQLSEGAWTKTIAGMSAKAQFAAELLAGQMPQGIGEVFRETGTSLFPVQRSDLVTTCSCPDWGDPCKHVAATHYVLGEALDRDPFLLFELRGRTKEQVLAALRAARGGEVVAQTKHLLRKEPEVATVHLGTLSPADYDRPREALPATHLSLDAPLTHGAILRQLGAPAAWGGEGAPADVLAPLMHAAAEAARRLAMAEPASVDRASAAGATTPGRSPARSPNSAKSAKEKSRRPASRKPT